MDLMKPAGILGGENFVAKVASLLLLGLTACTTPSPHGRVTPLTTSAEDLSLCAHQVPAATCTRCHPEKIPEFKAAGDWCAEHEVPESQCLICHPDLNFEPLPALPPDADVGRLSEAGEDVEALETFVVPGKVTIFDFYADWCGPCRKIDAHVFGLLKERKDLALRKLNVVSWETPLAKHHLAGVESLPYVVIYGRNGQRVKAISGLDLSALDAAIAEGSQQ
jgi:thiol-disulfide isomerase/thioredoxin